MRIRWRESPSNGFFDPNFAMCYKCEKKFPKIYSWEPKLIFACTDCDQHYCRQCLAHISLDVGGTPNTIGHACLLCHPESHSDDPFFNNKQ